MMRRQWLACDDPHPMLLRAGAGERMLRLFCCACCRLLEPLLSRRQRKAVSPSESGMVSNS